MTKNRLSYYNDSYAIVIGGFPMRIVFVADTLDEMRPGPARTAYLYRRLLEKCGFQVVLVACRGERIDYPVGKRYMPFLSRAARRYGITYGKPDERQLLLACDGADLVFIAAPFGLGNKAHEIARRLNLPVLIGMPLDAAGWIRLSGLRIFQKKPEIAYRYFYNELYCKCTNILCADEATAAALPAYGYTARLHSLSDADLTCEDAPAKLRAILQKTQVDEARYYANESRQGYFRRNWAIFRSSIDIRNPYANRNAFFRAWYFLCYYSLLLTACLFVRVVFGLRVKGKENKRAVRGGTVTVSNHVHDIDGAMVAAALFPRRLTFTSIEGNFRLPVVRWLVKWIGVVPIPSSTHLLKDFFALTTEQLEKGRWVHIYPEGSLWLYAQDVRDFKKGAFHMASDADVPALPVALVQRPCRGWRRLFRRKPLFTAYILPPVYPDPSLAGSKKIEDMRARTQSAVRDILEKNRY